MENQIIPTPEITPQPILTPLVNNPPNKSYLPLILTIIAILFLSIFSGIILGKYLFGPQGLTPVPTLAPKPTIIPTISNESTQSTSSKIYTNTKYGYSVKYPLSWNIEKNVNYGDPNKPEYTFFFKQKMEFVPGISIYVIPQTTPDKWIGKDIIKPALIKDISVDGITGKQILNIPGALENQWVFLDKNQQTFILYVSGNQEEINTFTSFLSTFKFLDTTPTPPTSYTACGCGCCGGTTPNEQCLYKSKNDSLERIIEEDKKATNSSQCATVGCAKGIIYKYCD